MNKLVMTLRRMLNAGIISLAIFLSTAGWVMALMEEWVTIPGNPNTVFEDIPAEGSDLRLTLDAQSGYAIDSSGIYLKDDNDTVQWYKTPKSYNEHVYEIGTVLSSREWLWVTGAYHKIEGGGGTGPLPEFNAKVAAPDVDVAPLTDPADEGKEEIVGVWLAKDGARKAVTVHAVKQRGPNSQQTLTWSSVNLSLWTEVTNGEMLIGSSKSDISAAQGATYYAQGINANSSIRDSEIVAEYTVNYQVARDRVNLTVVGATIEAFDTICVNATNDVIVDLLPTSPGTNITLQIECLDGSGSAKFMPSDTTTSNITNSATVKIKGVTASSAVSNMMLKVMLGSDVLASNKFTVVGLQSPLQYKIGTNSWANMPDPLYVCKDTAADFKAVKTPTNAPWPSGKPVWGGVLSGSGIESNSYTFATISTNGTDYKLATAECGNTVTGKVIVIKVDIVGHKPSKLSSSGSSVSEADEDGPDNLFIAVNDDNDDNGLPVQKDNRDNAVGADDDDAVRLSLTLQPPISNGVIELSFTPTDSLRLFKGDGQSLLSDTSVDLSSPSGDLAGLATVSVDIVVEAKDVATGDPATNIRVRLVFKSNGQEVSADEIHMHATWIILPSATIWNPFRFYFGNCGEDELKTACINRGFTVTDRLATVDPGNGPNLYTVNDFFDDISSRSVGILWVDGHGNAASNVVPEIPIETYTNYATVLTAFNSYTNQGFASDELVIRAGYPPKPWALCVTTKFIDQYCMMRDHSAVFLALCYSAVPGGGAQSLADAFAGITQADNSFGYNDVSYTDELISDTKAIFETIGGLKPIGGIAKNYTIKEAYDGGGIDTNQASWPAQLLRGDHTVDSVRMYVPH